MGDYVLPILAGVAALFLLRRTNAAGVALNAPPDATPLATAVPNYPPSTPDTASTGIASAVASAFKPPAAAALAAAPPAADDGPILGQPPPPYQPLPVAPYMGGANWDPASAANGTAPLGQFAPTTAPTPVLVVTSPTLETRTGRGHF